MPHTSVLNAGAYRGAHVFVWRTCSGKHQQVFWVPCVHADMYYVCGKVVGMDVEFVKLVYVRHPL